MSKEYDLEKVARDTMHPLGCNCCWCSLAKSNQDWKRAEEKFKKTSNIFDDICGLFK